MQPELGWPGMIRFSANRCPHCGDRTFYDLDPILCSRDMFVYLSAQIIGFVLGPWTLRPRPKFILKEKGSHGFRQLLTVNRKRRGDLGEMSTW